MSEAQMTTFISSHLASAWAGRVNQRWPQLRNDYSKPSPTAILDLPGQADPWLASG